jgi:hypothetical protein
MDGVIELAVAPPGEPVNNPTTRGQFNRCRSVMAQVRGPSGSAHLSNLSVCWHVARNVMLASSASSPQIATAVWVDLWGSIPMMTVMSNLLVRWLGTAKALLIWVVVLIPLSSHSRQGRGGTLFAKKPANNGDGRHLASDPATLL